MPALEAAHLILLQADLSLGLFKTTPAFRQRFRSLVQLWGR
jgi:hypothetical protein